MVETNRFLEKFFADNPVSESELKHFSSDPWTRELLDDRAYDVVPTYSRILKPDGEDYFFSTTINTAATIPNYLTLRLRDFQTLPDSKRPPKHQPIVIDHKRETIVPEKPDCIFLINFGERGVDGHPQVVHGGMTCALLDETMGLMIMLHHQNVAGAGPRDLLFTANLNISFLGQVPTPGNVVIRTWMTRREGRKWYATGQIVDQNGSVLSQAEGLWLVTKGKL